MTTSAAANYTMEERKEPVLVKFGQGELCEGILIGFEKVQIDGKEVIRYTVQPKDGGDLEMFHGVHQINKKLRPTDLGKYIVVRCTGEDKSVVRNGNAMKTFDVLVSKEKAKDADKLIITDADIPF
jgi:hypothetical protein